MAWAPAIGEDRRKDYTRAQARARALRRIETPHEQRLWKLLRQLNREGANFRRQANVGNRVFDFADLGRRLLIELDGAVHEQPEIAEAARDRWRSRQTRDAEPQSGSVAAGEESGG